MTVSKVGEKEIMKNNNEDDEYIMEYVTTL